jgi:hypothetical protein
VRRPDRLFDFVAIGPDRLRPAINDDLRCVDGPGSEELGVISLPVGRGGS